MTKKELKAVLSALNEAMEFDEFVIEEEDKKAYVRNGNIENLLHLYLMLRMSTLGNIILLKCEDRNASNHIEVLFY